MSGVKAFLRKYRHSALRYIPILYIFFTFLFLLLRFPEEASTGVKVGINLCLESLIPSLYPFMVAVELLNFTGLLTRNNRLFSFFSQKLFRLPYSFGVFLLSCLGGYPVGAMCINGLVKKGAISKSAGENMLFFTVNPSLNFAVSFVGAVLYKSIKAGVVLYISNILASLIVGIIIGRLKAENNPEQPLPLCENKISFSVAFTSSVKKAAASMFYICAFTVLFSSLCELFEIMPFSFEVKLILKCIAEVTNGINSAYRVCSLPFIASILSFGGLSVAFQIFSSQTEFKVSYLKFIIVRLVSAALSYSLASLFLRFFPVTVSTFSSEANSYAALTSHSVPVSVGLILMTLIFIGEDSFVKAKRLDRDSS